MFLNAFTESIFYFCLLIFIVLILLFVVYILETLSTYSLYKKTLDLIGKNVIGFLDRNGNIIYLTDAFYSRINVIKKNKWKKSVSKIIINEEEVSYEKLEKMIKDSKDEKSFNLVIETNDSHQKAVFVLNKKELTKNGKVVSYVLFEEEIEEKDSSCFKLFDISKSPYAYYSGKKDEVNFTMNKSFCDLLGLSCNKLTYNGLEKCVYDDTDFHEKVNSDKQNITYKLLTKKGIELFEEYRILSEDKITSYITKKEISKENKYLSINDLSDRINVSIKENKDICGMIIAFNSLIEENVSHVNILTKEIIEKYFRLICDEYSINQDNIVRINEYEYIVLIEKTDVLDKVINDIRNNKCFITDCDLLVNGDKVRVINKIGIAHYEEKYKDMNTFLKSLYSALSLTNKDGYSNNYCIYSQYKDSIEDEEYSFEKCINSVDLDNSFLYDGK